MDKVKEFTELGLPIPAAIKAALEARGLSVSAFAAKHGVPYGTASNVINAVVRATDPMIAAFIAEFGGTAESWRELLWEAMRPPHLAAS